MIFVKIVSLSVHLYYIFKLIIYTYNFHYSFFVLLFYFLSILNSIVYSIPAYAAYFIYMHHFFIYIYEFFVNIYI